MSPYTSPQDARRSRLGRNPANIGLAALLAAVALVFINFTKLVPWEQPHEVHFVFRDSVQIVKNSPVRVAGIEVGKVTRIEAGPGQSAVVTADIQESGLPIRRDATAKIRPKLFLEGNFFIDLKPGSPSARELPEGGTIPIGQTAIPVQATDFAQIAPKDIREIFKGGLKELVDATSGDFPAVTQRFSEDLGPLSSSLSRVNEGLLGTRPHDLSQALAATARTLAAIGRRREDFGSLVDTFAESAAALAAEQQAIGASVVALNTLGSIAPRALATLNASFPDTRALVRELRPGLRAAVPALDEAGPAVAQLRGALRPNELPALARVLAPTVRGLAGFTPRATTLFRTLAPTVHCVRHNVVPVVQTEVPDGEHSTGRPVYRDLLANLVGLASASRTFDGNGFSTRYLAGFGDEIISTPLGTPGGSPLLGRGDGPTVGSRPRNLGPAPEFHPEAPCEDQPRTDFRAQTGPPDFQPTGRSAPASPILSQPLTRVLSRLRSELRRNEPRLRRLLRDEIEGARK